MTVRFVKINIMISRVSKHYYEISNICIHIIKFNKIIVKFTISMYFDVIRVYNHFVNYKHVPMRYNIVNFHIIIRYSVIILGFQ